MAKQLQRVCHDTLPWLISFSLGERKLMSAIPPAHRIELSPAVRVILEAESPKSQFLKDFLRYQQALLDPDTARLDNGVTPDGCFPELEPMCIPPRPVGVNNIL